MRRWLRRGLWTLATLLLVPVVLIGGALLFINTDPGQRMIERIAAGQVTGLRLEGLRGPLPGHPRLDRITMADADGVWLEVVRPELDLDLAALLHREVKIGLLGAEAVVLHRLPASTTPPPPPDPDAPVLPRLPSLPLGITLDRLAVARIALPAALVGQAAELALNGQGSLNGEGLRARLDLQRQDAGGQVSLELALAPGDGRLQTRLTVAEPAGGVAGALAGQPGQALAVDFQLDGPATGAALSLRVALGPEVSVTAQGLVHTAADGSFGGTLAGEARLTPFLLPQIAALTTPLGFSVDAEVSAARQLALRQLRVAAPAGAVLLAGSADLARETLDLTAAIDVVDAERFRPLVPAGIGFGGVHADARITGTMAQPAVHLEAAPAALATGTPQLDAALGAAPRLVADIAMPGPRFRVNLTGSAVQLAADGTLAEPFAANAVLTVPDLAPLAPQAQGGLRVEAQASGARADPSIRLTATSGRLGFGGRSLDNLQLAAEVATPASAPRVRATASGALAGLPLTLAVNGQPDGQRLRLEQGEFGLGPARLTMTGLLDPQAATFDGEGRLVVPDLAPFAALAGVPDLAGRIELEARLHPVAGVQNLDLRLNAPNLRARGNSAAIQATATGTAAAIDWTAQARATAGNLAGRGHVAHGAEGWRLDLAALSAEARGESLRLTAPAHVLLRNNGGVQLSELALTTGQGGRIQAGGSWGPERAAINATFTALPLTLAQPVLPEPRLAGTLSGTVAASGPIGRPEIRATLRGDGLRAEAPWSQGLPALTLRAEGSLAGEAVQARAEIGAGPGGSVIVTAQLPRGFGPAAPVTARADGTLQLATLAAPFLAAGADRFTGRLAVALRADGTVGTPRLGGTATLSGGDYRNLQYGVRVTGLGGTISGEGTRLAIQNFSGRTVGGGRITLGGSIDAGAAGFPVQLTLTARDARPVSSDLIAALIDADIRVAGPVLGGGRVDGEVRIRQAELRVPERIPASVPTLPEVRMRGRTPPGTIPRTPAPPPRAAAAPPAPPLALGVRVVAERVFIRGRGLDVQLGGAIEIGGTIAAPLPRGTLNLNRGTLDVLARQLTFRRGVIGFDSGTLVPELDLLASSTSGAYTLNVAVKGTPADPKLSFSASPELPQDEVLAQLLFGQPTSSLSPFQIAQLASALGQLTGVTGGSGPGVFDRVRTATGLDRLGITSNAAGQSQLEAGRYVAPGVFVGVRQGAGIGGSGTGSTGGSGTSVGVQVEITPRLKLEGQTATGPAGDRLGLAYELEY